MKRDLIGIELCYPDSTVPLDFPDSVSGDDEVALLLQVEGRDEPIYIARATVKRHDDGRVSFIPEADFGYGAYYRGTEA